MIELQAFGHMLTDFDVTHRHFGGNIIGSIHTEQGTPDASFREAIDALNIQDLRYPAGEPDVAYAGGLLINGQLPDHVHNFFASIADRPGEVVMVTPTFSSYTGAEDIQRFAELVMESYGDRIRAWEIGNEYWQQQNETDYGRIAEQTVQALSAAMDGQDIVADIWVQMGNASGGSSDYLQHPELGWVDSTIQANKDIIAQLSDNSIAAIDGLVEHVYLRDTGQIIGNEQEATNMAHLDLQVWEETTGRTFDFAVTEWNVKTTNVEQHGLKGGSALLQHTENLLRLGADDMHIWAPQHNTKTDLAGSNQVLFDADTGYVNNTVLGAVYDTMSTALPGKTLVDLQINGELGALTTHAYAGAGEVVVYVASRSEAVEQVSFSLGDHFGDSVLRQALHIGIDTEARSSDGQHYQQSTKSFTDADYLIIDGERHYYNEHDANAALSYLDIGVESASGFSFELLPYEIVQLTYSLPSATRATAEGDTLTLDNGDSRIDLLAGDDAADAGAGHDTVSGGAGNDDVYGNAGNDTLYGDAGLDHLRGGAGDDTLSGGSNHDRLFGGEGDDTLDGGEGFDHLEGGSGNDVISGGTGADKLIGGGGEDILNGGSGSDFLDAGNDNDHLSGGTGRDTLKGGGGDDLLEGESGSDRLLGGTGEDVLDGGRGADTLDGGAGDDTLNGGAGDDRLFGNNGADTFAFADDHGDDVIEDFDTLTPGDSIDFSGNSTLTRFQDVMPNARQDGEDVLIETGAQSSLRIKNTELDALEENDFLF